jgi:hypothetical protein
MLWEGVLAQELGYSAATWDSVTVFLLEQASPSSAGSRPVSGAYEAAAALQLPVPDAARGPGGDNGGGESKLEGGGQGDEDGAAAPAVVGASQAAALPDPVQLTMTLGMSFHETGEEGSSKREAFKRDVANDLAKASGLPAENFKITKLSAGSVIVDIDILPDPLGIAPAPSDVARDLQKQTADPNSPLRSGKLTSQTQVIQVLSPQPTTGAPPPPPTQTIVEERKKVFVRRSLHKSRRPQNETPKFALDANRNMTPLEWEKERYIVRKRRDAHTGTLPCLHACTRAYIHASCVFEYLFRVFALDVHGFPWLTLESCGCHYWTTHQNREKLIRIALGIDPLAPCDDRAPTASRQEGGSAGGKGAPGTDAGLEEEKQNNELGTAKTQRDKLAQEVQQLKAEISITKSDLDSTRKEKDKQNTHKNLL